MRELETILLDMLADALMLVLALRFVGRRGQAGRVLAASALGAGLAALCRALSLSHEQTAALWLPTAALMMATAGGQGAVRGALLLLAAAGLLGGSVQALYGATGSLRAAYALGAAVACGMSACAMRERRHAQTVYRVRVRCRYRGREAEFEAMVDSGNCLRDYLTHRPVIVLPTSCGKRLCPTGDGTRLLFANTAGGRRMMACFAPEKAWVQADGAWRAVTAVLAIAPELDGPALLPISLLDEMITEKTG